MIELVKKFIIENNLTGKKILVGLSGGADSVCLSDILFKLKNELNLTLIFIHLNHNWRKNEAKSDEIFCKNFADERNIPFYTEMLPKKIKQNETTAREARYRFFKRCKEKFAADAVFLAHNKNDNVETLIYRLIKGTGPKGMSSIPPVRDFYFRPFLGVLRGEIEEYIKKAGLLFVVDKTNFDTIHKRNLIRKDILPKMAEINKDVLDSVSTFIKINQMHEKIVEKAVNTALLEVETNGKILRDKFLNLDIELQYEILNKKLQGHLKNRDFKTIERVLAFIKENTSAKFSINSTAFLKIYNNKIYLLEMAKPVENKSIPLKEGKNYFMDKIITLEKVNAPNVFPKDNKTYFLNLDLTRPYSIRTREKGDKIIPFASSSPQKIKDIFINKKIPEETRDKVPLIECGGEILLIIGVLAGEKLRVDKNQKFCYKLTMEKI